jgi:hypothetical protein
MPVHQPPIDIDGMEERMDAIRLKQMLGGALTDQELMCLQMAESGFGCASCSSVDARLAQELP